MILLSSFIGPECSVVSQTIPLLLPGLWGCSGCSRPPLDLFVLQPSRRRKDPNWAARRKRWGNGQRWIVINNTAELVRLVKSRCGTTHYIRTLRIGGHGTNSGFRLGRDWVSMGTMQHHEADLRQIAPYLRPGQSVVYLDHCNVGHAEQLMMSLSDILGGVAVIGPAESQHTNTGPPEYEGPARICGPKTCKITLTPNVPPDELVTFLKSGQTQGPFPASSGGVCR